ncbi:MAG: hypothetical protein P3A28_09165, partial [Gemmatimonadota bacterium]|nr:hypothetical protein [Gemmatimonadota bacterium]
MRIPVRILAPLAGIAFVGLSAPTAPLPAQQLGERMANRSANPLLTNFRFRSVGPASMGGRIDDVEAFPGNPSIIYIGYASGGVWKSVNMGTTWEPIFDEMPVASIGDIAIHPSNPDIVYVGTGESNNRQSSTFGGGMFKTTDGGKTWTDLGLTGTQSISRVVIDPRNPETVYVAANGPLFGASPDRGLYKSTDGGKTWNKSKYIDENTGFTDLAIDPSNSNVLYAASYQRRRTSCCFNGGGPGSAVWKTTDAGRTWNKVVGPGLSATGSYGRIAIAIAKSNPGTVYFQIEGGDVGRLGTATAAPQTAAQANAAAAAAAEAGLGGGRGGGYDWCNNAGPGRGFGAGGRGADTPNAAPPLNPTDGGVYRTSDGGRTWTLMSNCNARPMYFSQLRVDPTNANIVYASGLPWTKSMDGGKTFATLDAAGGNNTSGHVDNHAMWINPNNPRHIMIGNDGGLNISWDQGHTWDYVNTMAAAYSYWVSADMRRPYRVYTGLQDNGTWGAPSTTRGAGLTHAHWYGVGGGDGFQTAADPTAWNIIFTESQNGNTSRYDLLTGASVSVRPTPVGGGTGLPPSTLAGCNDGRIAGPGGRGGGGGGGGGFGGGGAAARGNVLNAQPGDGARFNWNTPFQLSPHNPRVFWIGGARIYRSDNQGDTYMQSADLTKRIDRCKVDVMAPGNTTQLSKNDGLTSYSTIISLSESPVRAGVVWAGTDDGNVQVSRDNGVTFTEVGKNIPGMPQGALNGETNLYWISRIEASHFDAATAYVAIDGHRSNDLKPYAFVTTDYGATWRNISSNLPAGNLQAIREDLKNPDLLFAGTEFGLFVSLNRGQSWEKFMNNYPTVRTDEVYIHPREGDLVVASHGRGIYIADDITALQQFTPAVRVSDAHLFDVRPAVAWINDRQDNHRTAAAQKAWRGENAPRGSAISYYLRTPAQGAVTLAITDAQGRTLCSGSAPNVAGINRVQWAMTAPGLAGGGGAGGRGG